MSSSQLFAKYQKNDSVQSNSTSYLTCTSTLSPKSSNGYCNSNYIQNSMVTSCLENENLLLETQKLVKTIENWPKSKNTTRKSKKKYSADYKVFKEDFLAGEETLDILRNQVDQVKRLDNEKLNKSSNYLLGKFSRSFESEDGQYKPLRIKRDLKFDAFLKLIILFKFN